MECTATDFADIGAQLFADIYKHAPDVAAGLRQRWCTDEFRTDLRSLIVAFCRTAFAQSQTQHKSAEFQSLVSMLHDMQDTFKASSAQAAQSIAQDVNASLATNMTAMMFALKQAADNLHNESLVDTLQDSLVNLLNAALSTHKDVFGLSQQQLAEQLRQVPALTRGVIADVLHNMEMQQQSAAISLNEARKGIDAIQTTVRDQQQSLAMVTHRTECMQEKIDTVEKHMIKQTARSTIDKGKHGEDKLFDWLCERLRMRDGYVVEKTNGQACGCDIVIKRHGGYPDIRIESKAIGESTKEKVRHAQVTKFIRDLEQTQNHGIFVSLYSDIVGISNFELQQLSNGKFAVYLTKLNTDLEPIIEMIQLLYTLDKILSKQDNAEDGTANMVRIPAETMACVQQYLKDYGTTIFCTKQHLRIAYTKLGEIDMNMIASMILGNSGDIRDNKATSASDATATEDNQFKCPRCTKTFTTKRALQRHSAKNACVQVGIPDDTTGIPNSTQ